MDTGGGVIGGHIQNRAQVFQCHNLAIIIPAEI